MKTSALNPPPARQADLLPGREIARQRLAPSCANCARTAAYSWKTPPPGSASRPPPCPGSRPARPRPRPPPRARGPGPPRTTRRLVERRRRDPAPRRGSLPRPGRSSRPCPRLRHAPSPRPAPGSRLRHRSDPRYPPRTEPRPGPRMRWTALAIGTAGSLAANIAIAGPGVVSRVVAGWPALALLIAVKLLSGMLNQHVSSPRAPGAAPSPSADSTQHAAPSPQQFPSRPARTPPASHPRGPSRHATEQIARHQQRRPSHLTGTAAGQTPSWGPSPPSPTCPTRTQRTGQLTSVGRAGNPPQAAPRATTNPGGAVSRRVWFRPSCYGGATTADRRAGQEQDSRPEGSKSGHDTDRTLSG
jgi:hypothetical protein